MNPHARRLVVAAAFVGGVATAFPTGPALAQQPSAMEKPMNAESLQSVLPDPAALADEIESAWVKNDLRWWFPRCVDPAGGFYETFDADGKGVENAAKHCIFQSRMTWVAATICVRRPEYRKEFEPIVRHGLKFLNEKMSSPDGGMWWGVGPDGQPEENRQRHLYNMAFAIYGASAAEEALPGEGGLKLADRLFDWLEKNGRTDHPGYAEHYARDGHAILTLDDPAAAANHYGPLLPFYGDKSMNAQIHILEALTELHHVSDDPRVEQRLRDSLTVLTEHLYGEPGFLHLWLNGDLTALPDETSYGHNVETAYLLLEAADELGETDDETWRKSAALVDTAIRVGWDQQNGALNDSGNTFEAKVFRKDWWVQAESLNATLLMADHANQTGDGDYTAAAYATHFQQQWQFIEQHLIDHEAGGWYWGVDGENHLDETHKKAEPWKTSYHTTRALLNVTDRLRRMAK